MYKLVAAKTFEMRAVLAYGNTLDYTQDELSRRCQLLPLLRARYGTTRETASHSAKALRQRQHP